MRENNILRFDIQAKMSVSQAATLMYFLKKSVFEAISPVVSQIFKNFFCSTIGFLLAPYCYLFAFYQPYTY